MNRRHQHAHTPGPGGITRRALLGAAAGGAALVASSALPAWARPVAQAAGLRRPDSLPFPGLPAGHASMPEIEHIVVLMMENHSFDNLLGMVPYRVPGRAAVDGLTRRDGQITNWNPDPSGRRVHATKGTSPCQLDGAPSQSWDASHQSYDNGRNDGFVRASGPVAMRYWDDDFLPFSYSLARYFPIGERYFCSVLAQTYPNRRYLFTGTSSGITATDGLTFSTPAANGTIWDRLDDHHIDWGVYYKSYPGAAGTPSMVVVPGAYTAARAHRVKEFTHFAGDLAAGKLPQFTFIDPQYSVGSEENPQDIQVGEEFVAGVVKALIKAPTWKRTALFINYDEHGGYYDHVPPPRAIAPDSIAPIQEPTQPTLAPGGFDRYGFRVPLYVVSPWAKAGYVSRTVQDHTSVTAFVERKWNLPAMTFRDANAHPMTDYFDFSRPAFAEPPALADAPGLAAGLAKCTAAGLKPPLPA
ncbi:MAG: phospholipase C [Solirubrobacteraceae bacterium]